MRRPVARTMSDRLSQGQHYLYLIFTATPIQKRALIQTSSTAQLKLIAEIVYNALKGQLKLSRKTEKLINKYKSVLTKISEKKQPESRRYKLIYKHWRIILNVLLALKNIILDRLMNHETR